MAGIKNREKWLGILAGISIGALLWSQFILKPIIDQERILDTRIRERSLKIKEAQKTLGGSARQVQAREFLARFKAQASLDEEMTTMIKDVERSAATARLKVLETKPQTHVRNVGWMELKMSLAIEGSWENVVRFFYELESDERSLLINDMLLETITGQQSLVRGRFEITRPIILGTD